MRGAPYRSDGTGPRCDALDEQVDDRLGGGLGVGIRHAPARKMTVDVHPRKAVDQRAGRRSHLLQVDRAQLALREASASIRPVMSISSALSRDTPAALS